MGNKGAKNAKALKKDPTELTEVNLGNPPFLLKFL
jgi:hypothetical protein